MNNFKTGRLYKTTKRLVFIFMYLIVRARKHKGRYYYLLKWIKDNGDNALLVNYPLKKNSLVVDVGGYKGFFPDKVISLCNPKLVILEPVKEFYTILKTKYKNNPKVKMYNFGLSNKSSFENIYLSDDGTSLIKKSDRVEKIKIEDVAKFVKKYKKIDLMSVNIEGSEYALLDRLVETKTLKRIKYLQVQFHQFVPNSRIMRKDILKKILKTHKVRYSYPFVWESFEIRNNG